MIGIIPITYNRPMGDLLIRGIFIALTILAFLSRACVASCPTRNDALPLNITRFSGEWFMLAGTPTSGNSVSRCCHFTITQTSNDTFDMNFTAVSRRSHRPVTFIMNAKVGDDVIGTWQLQGSQRVLGPFKHRVIAVQYDSYVVMVVCGDNNQDIPLKEFALILSRDISRSMTTLEKLKDKLSPYFSSDKILDVDHSGC